MSLDKSDMYKLFIHTGYYQIPSGANPEMCESLLTKIKHKQPLSENIFLDESVFLRNPHYKGVNPRPGFNLAEQFDTDLNKILQSIEPPNILQDFLGEHYQVRDRKFVCGVPLQWLPNWVKNRIKNKGVANLGAYIRPEYRNITYFCGIDFHQDMIDWSNEQPNLVTLYIYLNTVSAQDAPVQILPQSHQLGLSTFPHKLEPMPDSYWMYTNDQGQSIQLKEITLTGAAGHTFFWHGLLLHGTNALLNHEPRVSIRYLLEVDPLQDPQNIVTQINKSIQAPLIGTTRKDLDDLGDYRDIESKNHIKKQNQPCLNQ